MGDELCGYGRTALLYAERADRAERALRDLLGYVDGLVTAGLSSADLPSSRGAVPAAREVLDQPWRSAVARSAEHK